MTGDETGEDGAAGGDGVDGSEGRVGAEKASVARVVTRIVGRCIVICLSRSWFGKVGSGKDELWPRVCDRGSKTFVAVEVGEVPIPRAGVPEMQVSDLEPEMSASNSLYSALADRHRGRVCDFGGLFAVSQARALNGSGTGASVSRGPVCLSHNSGL
jgi:hypothetical protein